VSSQSHAPEEAIMEPGKCTIDDRTRHDELAFRREAEFSQPADSKLQVNRLFACAGARIGLSNNYEYNKYRADGFMFG